MSKKHKGLMQFRRFRIEDALRKRVKVLEAALLPFAQEACEWSNTISDGYHPGVTEPRQQFSYAKAMFSMRDLRRAARLLEIDIPLDHGVKQKDA